MGSLLTVTQYVPQQSSRAGECAAEQSSSTNLCHYYLLQACSPAHLDVAHDTMKSTEVARVDQTHSPVIIETYPQE